MNEKFEKYIKDLSPELQKKARACKTKEEILALAADNDIELPEEALEAVSGGQCGNSKPQKCPKCGSTDIREFPYGGNGYEKYCGNCDYTLYIWSE